MAEAPVTGQRRPMLYGTKRSALTRGLAGDRPALAGEGPASAPGYRPAVSLVPAALGRKASSADWISVHINLLRVTDSLLIAGAVALGYHRSSPGLLDRTSTAAGIAASVALALIWIAALEIYKTRDPKVLGVGADEYKRVISATFRLFGFIAIASVVFSIESGATMFAVSLPVGILSLTANRWLFRRRLATEKAKGRHLSRAIVVGEPEDVRYVVQQIEKKSGPVYKILGVCLPGSRRGAPGCPAGR